MKPWVQADVDLAGEQPASAVESAIAALAAAGNATIGLGRRGAVKIQDGDTVWGQEIDIPAGVTLVLGKVVDGSFRMRASGARLFGGELIRRDPAAEPAHLVQIGSAGDPPVTDWEIAELCTVIEAGAGASVFAYTIHNGVRGRVVGCDHRSRASALVEGSGQAFCVCPGGSDLEIACCSSEVVNAGAVQWIEDDFVNFSALYGPLPERIRVHHNCVIGHAALLSVSHGRNIEASDNYGRAVIAAGWLKAGVYSGTPDAIENVRILRNQIVDPDGRAWQQVLHAWAVNGGQIRDVIVDGLGIEALPMAGGSTNMVQLKAESGGRIERVAAHNVTLELAGDIQRILSTRGAEVDPIDGIHLRNWRLRGGAATAFGAPYDLLAGYVPDSLVTEAMDLGAA
jgi:hypothetical protein